MKNGKNKREFSHRYNSCLKSWVNFNRGLKFSEVIYQILRLIDDSLSNANEFTM